MTELISTTNAAERLTQQYGVMVIPAMIRLWIETERVGSHTIGGAYVLDYDEVSAFFEESVLSAAKRIRSIRARRAKGCADDECPDE